MRKTLEIREIKNDNFHTLLVKVEVNRSIFWEYYVGVSSKNNFYSRLNYMMNSPQSRYIIEKAFIGCDQYVGILAAKRPLDGAWLSFARLGKVYDFLKDDFFYYGGGFYIYQFPEEENINDAKIMIERILTVVQDKSFKKVSEITKEEVLSHILTQGESFKYYMFKKYDKTIIEINNQANIDDIDIYSNRYYGYKGVCINHEYNVCFVDNRYKFLSNNKKDAILKKLEFSNLTYEEYSYLYNLRKSDIFNKNKKSFYFVNKNERKNIIKFSDKENGEKLFDSYEEAIFYKMRIFPLNKEERSSLLKYLK